MQTTSEQCMSFEDARKYFVYRMPVIRGVCILAVVASHISPIGGRFVAFGVPVFILLSGLYLSLNHRNERWPGFYRRTLKFLLIPYTFYSLVYAIPRAVRGWTLNELWHGFLSSEIERALWFMPMIIGLYLLHPWLRRLYRKSQVGVCFTAFALQLYGWPLMKANGLPEGAATTLLSSMAMLGYFVAGYFILDHAKAALRICERWTGRIASVAVWLLWPSLSLWSVDGDVGGWIAKALNAASVVAAFFVLASVSCPESRVGKSVARWVACFGLYSYGVYLLHPLVISVVSRVVTQLTGLRSGEFLWGLLVFTLTAYAALLIVKWLANRPLGRYIT